MRFRLMPMAVFAAALISLIASDALAGRAGPGGRKRPPPLVSVQKAVRRSVRSRLTVVGTIAPNRTSIVSSEIEGRVKSALIKEGDPVVAGKTVIAALQRSDLEINLRIERVELTMARARFKEREAELSADAQCL